MKPGVLAKYIRETILGWTTTQPQLRQMQSKHSTTICGALVLTSTYPSTMWRLTNTIVRTMI